MTHPNPPQPTPNEQPTSADPVNPAPGLDTPAGAADTETVDSGASVDAAAATPRAKVPPAFWGLLAAGMIASFAGGYLVGVNKTPAQDTTTTAQAPASTANPAAPEGATTPPSPTPMTVDEAKKLGITPGKEKLAPQAGANGFDGTIYGPGAPVNSKEDILNIHRRNPADPFALGAVDAPVVISVFSDFECPFCARFAQVTEPVILENYVHTGLVRIEFNDMPINGDHAVAAAKAGRAAAAQGKFFEFEEALFAAPGSTQGHPNNTIDDFVEFAKDAGVADLDRFRKEASDDTYTESVNKARDYAAGLGVNGTPAFVIGQVYVSGAQPTEVFIQAINQELTKVGNGTVPAPTK